MPIRAAIPLAQHARNKDIVDRFFSHVAKSEDSCWLWNGAVTSRGYGNFGTPSGMVQAHRFAYAIINGDPPPEKPLVLHSCDRPLCVRGDHLRCGTATDNVHDTIERDRLRHPRRTAPMSQREVDSIRTLAAAGFSLRYLASWFDRARSTISDIVDNKTWKHMNATINTQAVNQ